MARPVDLMGAGLTAAAFLSIFVGAKCIEEGVCFKPISLATGFTKFCAWMILFGTLVVGAFTVQSFLGNSFIPVLTTKTNGFVGGFVALFEVIMFLTFVAGSDYKGAGFGFGLIVQLVAAGLGGAHCFFSLKAEDEGDNSGSAAPPSNPIAESSI